MKKRRESRIIIIKSLYENDVKNTFNTKSLLETYKRIAEEEKREVLLNEEFYLTILNKIASFKDEYDEIINKIAKNSNKSIIGILDRNILRLGLFELLNGEKIDVPPKVAVSESVDLAKLFLSDNGYKFINGVLGVIYDKEKDNYKNIKTNKNEECATGAIIYNEKDNEIKFALVYDIFDKWTLSKGKINSIEDAEKELPLIIKKEIGLEVEIEKECFENIFNINRPDGFTKMRIKYFLAVSKNDKITLEKKEGIKDAKWFTNKELRRLSIYPDIKDKIFKIADEVSFSKTKK